MRAALCRGGAAADYCSPPPSPWRGRPPPRSRPSRCSPPHRIARSASTAWSTPARTSAPRCTWAAASGTRSSTGERCPASGSPRWTPAPGALLPWAPGTNGTVFALTASGSSLYVSGKFTTVAGQPRAGLADVSLTTGTVGPLRHTVQGVGYALATGGGRLYLGGTFTAVDGRAVRNLAAFRLTDGAFDTAFRGEADGQVKALTVAGSRLYVGGTFRRLNGADNTARLAALRPTDGLLDPGFRPATPYGVGALTVTPDRVYAGLAGPGGRVAAYRPDGGLDWSTVTDGDVQAITHLRGVVYAGGHFTVACPQPSRTATSWCPATLRSQPKLVAFDATTGSLLDWNPRSNGNWGVLTMNANATLAHNRGRRRVHRLRRHQPAALRPVPHPVCLRLWRPVPAVAFDNGRRIGGTGGAGIPAPPPRLRVDVGSWAVGGPSGSRGAGSEQCHPISCRSPQSAQCQPESPRARGPCQMQIGWSGVTVIVEFDLVEPGEVAVGAGHDGVVLGPRRLVGQDPDIGPAPLALETNLHRLAGAQVAPPRERRSDQQDTLMRGVGDRGTAAGVRTDPDGRSWGFCAAPGRRCGTAMIDSRSGLGYTSGPVRTGRSAVGVGAHT